MRRLGLGLVFLLLVSVAACSQRTGPPVPSASPIPASSPRGKPLSHSGGGVTVEVLPARLPSSGQGSTVFQVALNTHSVDLDAYDLKNGVRLRDDRGNELAPGTVDVPLGGHHRSGTVTFEGPALAAAKYVELVVRGLAGVPERSFRWEVAQ